MCVFFFWAVLQQHMASISISKGIKTALIIALVSFLVSRDFRIALLLGGTAVASDFLL